MNAEWAGIYGFEHKDSWTNEEVEELLLEAAKYGFNYAISSPHDGKVPKGNILQWFLGCYMPKLNGKKQ